MLLHNPPPHPLNLVIPRLREGSGEWGSVPSPSLYSVIPAPRQESIPRRGAAHPEALEGSSGGATLANPSRPPPKSDTNPLTKAKHLYYIAHQARHPTPALIKE